MAKLDVIDVKNLNVFVNHLNVRQDVHMFAQYAQNRSIKRAYRSNKLPKADYNRLAKLMSDPDAREEIKKEGTSAWIDYVDDLALTLKFVTYDTEGRYVGYTSSEPSFPVRDWLVSPASPTQRPGPSPPKTQPVNAAMAPGPMWSGRRNMR